jgi:hypothetical protein
MIRYSLRCDAGHGFDSWFQTGAAFLALQTAGHLACPICGDTSIAKELMAPAVRPGRKAGDGEAAAVPGKGSLAVPGSEAEVAVAALKKHIEANSDYVGLNFVTEARRMHAGDVPERAIHGEARPEEARKLIEDGVPVAPLPFLPGRKVN